MTVVEAPVPMQVKYQKPVFVTAPVAVPVESDVEVVRLFLREACVQ